MNRNIGTVDRVVRIVLGVIVIAVGLWYRSWWGLIGLPLIATGIVGFCSLYVPFGINTCGIRRAPKENDGS